MQQPATRKVGCHTRARLHQVSYHRRHAPEESCQYDILSQQRLAYSSRQELRNKVLSQCHQSEGGGGWARIVSFSNDTMKLLLCFYLFGKRVDKKQGVAQVQHML